MKTQSPKKESRIENPASAVPNSRNSKTKNFLFLFEKNGGAQNLKKCGENFSVLDANFFKVCGRKRAESKSRNRDFPQKIFELRSNIVNFMGKGILDKKIEQRIKQEAIRLM